MRRALGVLGAGLVLVTVACGGSKAPTTAPLSSLGHLEAPPNPGALGPELIPVPKAPVLAPAASKATPTKTVDGIKCQHDEPLLFHIHIHLTLFVDGQQRQIPAGVGVWPKLQHQSGLYGQFVVTQGECFAWLITRFGDGLLHVEAPVKRSFDLGNFFDVWGQPLSSDQVGPARGPVTAIVNDRVWVGNPRDIPLIAHSQVQLEVGKPLIAPEHVTFPGGF